MDSPFDVLRIDPDAADGEIESAYRRRVMETHPDQGGSKAEFQLVTDAYEAIKADGYPDGNPFATEPADVAADEPTGVKTRVTYLNYTVLDDHGWSIDDPDLFEKASTVGLDHADYGQFLAKPGETLLQAAENRGFVWPFACRGGACANCAVAVLEGELDMPVDHILPSELLARGIRLSCGGIPITEELQVIYNVKHLPDLDDLRLPPDPFENAQAST